MNYFGSVKFYRHLIILVVLILMITPYIFAAFLISSNSSLKEQLEISENKLIYNNISYLDSMSISSVANMSTQYYDQKSIDYIKENLPYQSKYDDLYVERKDFVINESNEKTAYLTFDDGPSPLTLKILDLLDEYNIKATFFVTYKDDDSSISIYKEIVNRGHKIGIHTSSHVYDEIYSSIDAYLDDFYKIFTHIYDITGVKPDIFRFPGGSINPYNVTIHKEIIAEMLRRGFTYYDWNVDSGDGFVDSTKTSIIESVKNRSKNFNRIIVLMYDSDYKQNTYQALPTIIDYLNENNYNIEKLDSTIVPIIFAYKD